MKLCESTDRTEKAVMAAAAAVKRRRRRAGVLIGGAKGEIEVMVVMMRIFEHL